MAKDLQDLTDDERRDPTRLYELGLEAWKSGNIKRAITLYSMSAELKPDGPGAQALQLSRDIMDFYDTNQFNP